MNIASPKAHVESSQGLLIHLTEPNTEVNKFKEWKRDMENALRMFSDGETQVWYRIEEATSDGSKYTQKLKVFMEIEDNTSYERAPKEKKRRMRGEESKDPNRQSQISPSMYNNMSNL
ncbi:unnamed protein product [Arabidopsis thaliana]|uniref:Uncharacterized protein n=1 Tax=Arabidopsis thaliana TaxID=3702 RepID=A0A5S9WNR0_ARATH|nr:unnamed protein product [Arabidopsis thaliana]